MEADAVVRTMSALLAGPAETAESFLLAAAYCRALETGDSPRNVVEALYKALPDSDAWPPLRDALLAVLEGEEGRD